jgi:hypothetical protein
MDRQLLDLIWRRAEHSCEYCQLPAEFAETPFQVDHIIARKHGGPTVAENLALSCFYCNSNKGPNVSGIDPQSGGTTPLFHPRQQEWFDHFAWNGPTLMGKTPAGRATIQVLEINHPLAIAKRFELIQEGVFPQGDR